MARNIKGITIQLNGDATGLNNALQSVNQNIRKTQSDLKDVNRLLKLDPGNTDLLAQKQRLLADAINQTRQKLETLKTAQQQAAQQLAEGKIGQDQYDALQREIAETEQKLKSFNSESDATEKQLREMGDAAGDAAQDTGKLDISFKSMIQNAAINLAVDGLKALANSAKEAAKYVIEVGSSFEAGMDKVQAVSGASAADMEKLSAKAKEMGATTKFSASEAAEAMNYMAMAGWKTEDMLQGVEGIMNLAAASGEELATTSDIVTDALTAFGKSAKDSGRLADIMAAASSNANTNVSMMGETFKYAAPVAGALGASMEDTAVAVGLMANSGIKASQAGTALRTGLSNLAKPTKQMKEWMDKYNISLVENEDGSVNLRDTMIQLREKLGQLSETEQAAAASAIFGKNAMSGWMAIINASDEDFNKLADAIDNSDGAAKEMMETMGDNLQGKIKLLEASLEGLGIALYDKISGPLKIAVEAATGAISGLTEALQDHRSENELALDQIRDANEQMQKSIENSRSIMENAEIDASKVGVLGEALVNLNEQENLSASQKEALKSIYDKLVEVVPDLAKYYNEETGKIDLTREALEKLIKARREEIIEQGRIKAAQELLEAYGEAHAQLDLAMAKSEGMKAQKKMWEDLRDRIGEAQSAYVNLARDSQGNIIDTEGLKGLQAELLNVAQAALNSGTITTSTYEEIAELFKDDDWSESELISAYETLQGHVEDTGSSIADMSKEIETNKKKAEEASQEYNNYTKYVEGASESAENFAAVSRDSATSINDAREEHVALKKATEETREVTVDATEAVKDETESVDLNKEAHEELRQEIIEGNKERSAAGRIIPKTTEEIETETEAVHKAAEAQKNMREAATAARDDMRKAFEDIKKSAEDAFKINPFDQWSQDAEKGMLAFEEAMKSQRDGLLRYKDNLTTVKDNLGQTAPEFVQYLEDMGQGGAQLVAEFADAFRTGNADVVYRLMDEYKQALNIQDDVTGILEQDKLALLLGLEALTPEMVAAWEDLGYAFDEGKAVIEAKGGELSQSTTDSFWAAVDAAKAVGAEVPAGLAESIRNSEDPMLAIQEATTVINESLRGRGLEMLAAAQELGLQIPAGIIATLQDEEATGEQLQAAVGQLAETIKTKNPDFATAGTEAGEAMGDSTASGIVGKTADVDQSTTDLVNSAQTAGANAAPVFKAVGMSMMSMLNLGMLEKKQTVIDRVKANLNAARTDTTVTEAIGEFKTLGSDAMESLATGMESAISTVMDKVGELQTEISTAMSNISDIIGNTYLRFPNIQIPHVRWTWDTIYYGDGDWTQVPNFRVDWYAKAMQNGMILNKPTIFGMQGNRFLAGGEAGSETVVGTNSLMEMIKNAVSQGGTSFGDINIAVTSPVTDARTLAKELEVEISRNIIRRSGRF